ncbi:MAG: 1-phosphofructokinase [Fusobacteriaceae bacterium]
MKKNDNKIYTVTLNPAVDYYLGFENFKEGELNFPNMAYTLPGGKGINVSKVLANFKTNSVALGFVGGFTGHYMKNSLKGANIEYKFIELEENTRINIKINNHGLETEIAGKSPTISTEKKEEFLKELIGIKKDDILILSGSVPNSLDENIYSEIISTLPKGVKIVLDSRGKAFDLALKKGVYLVKPNQTELEEYFNRKITNEKELISAGKKMQELGAENVLISLGSKGSILITKESIFQGNVPKGKMISTVGAGDSMVAGVVYGLQKQNTLENAYKYGIASGSATAFSEGLGSFETMEQLLKIVNVEKLK